MNRFFLDNSIGEIIEKLNKKKISHSDITKITIENIKKLNPKYFAWTVYGNDALFEQEKIQYEKYKNKTGLLEGIPVGIKDVFNTANFPTQMGSPLWKDFTPGNDARTVFNLKQQGAIVVGKTVTAEFAVHTLNKTLNPYDITKTPGTSSSGSAVAVTLGMVPIATGTQTAGSIVRPASFCGIYGCKPSFGTIPRTGTLKTTDSLDTIGFFAIHQKDLKRMFDSMRVWGNNYPISNDTLSDNNRQNRQKGKPWRVGIVRTHTWENAPEYAKDALENFANKLSQQKNIEVVDVILPKSMKNTHTIHETIYNKALSYYFKSEHKKSDFVSPVMNSLIEDGNKINIDKYTKAIDDQSALIRDMDLFLKKFDVIISLSTAGEAPSRNLMELPDPALMWTLAHLPVVSIPNFKSPNGLPFGIQVAARKYNDYLLFNFLDYLTSIKLIPEKAGYFI